MFIQKHLQQRGIAFLNLYGGVKRQGSGDRIVLSRAWLGLVGVAGIARGCRVHWRGICAQQGCLETSMSSSEIRIQSTKLTEISVAAALGSPLGGLLAPDYSLRCHS